MRNRNINGTDIPCHWHLLIPDAKPCREFTIINVPNHALGNLRLCPHHVEVIARMAPKRFSERVVITHKTRRRTVHTTQENNLRITIAERDKRITELLGRESRLERELNELAEPKRRPVDMSQQGIVYILRSGGFYKIGWTADLGRRMKSYPPDTTLLVTYDGTRADEKKLHKRFAHLKTHGREWFAMGADLTAYVDAMITKHGTPGPVSFTAKPVQIPMPNRLNKRTGPTPKGWSGVA